MKRPTGVSALKLSPDVSLKLTGPLDRKYPPIKSVDGDVSRLEEATSVGPRAHKLRPRGAVVFGKDCMKTVVNYRPPSLKKVLGLNLS